MYILCKKGYCMKKCTVIFVGFILVLSFINVSCNHIEKGNGDLITFEKALSSFGKVNSGHDVEIRFHVSQEYRAVVTVDSNLEEYVELNIKNNTLNIGTKSRIGIGTWLSFTKYMVDIYCPSLSGITISGSGHFSL